MSTCLQVKEMDLQYFCLRTTTECQVGRVKREIEYRVSAMDCIVFPLSSYNEALPPNVTVFGDRTFIKEMIEVKWGHKGEALIQYAGVLIRRKMPGMHMHGGKAM